MDIFLKFYNERGNATTITCMNGGKSPKWE